MLQMVNMTTSYMDLDRFCDADHVKRFYEDIGLDGLETMLCGMTELPEKLGTSNVHGVHLKYFPSWMDLWTGNAHVLESEYGSSEAVQQMYGGKDKNAIIDWFRRDLDTAQAIGAKYVVFHVSESLPSESFTFKMRYTDAQVIDAANELLNPLLREGGYTFDFLFENLWWAGFTFTDVSMTKRLLDGLQYDKKGIMLDTGHLMHMDFDIETEQQAIAYILRSLDAHEDLLDDVKGIHLNQSPSGDYIKRVIAEPKAGGKGDVSMSDVLRHIYQIDYHDAFSDAGCGEIVERIAPDYLVHEMLSADLIELERKLRMQINTLEEYGRNYDAIACV